MLTLGVDLSHYQPRTDYGAVLAAGYAFAIVKFGEGLTITDDLAAEHWAGAGRVGMLRGAYHYFHAASGARAQVRRFLELVHHVDPHGGDLPPALDVEEADHLHPGVVADAVVDALDELATLTRRRPMLYGGVGFLSTLPDAQMREVAARADLWVASYTARPLMPRWWSRYALWQYQGKATVPGIHDPADVDRFEGSVEQIRTWGAGGALPKPRLDLSTPRALQAALNATGALPRLKVDGDIREKSRAAIRAFQVMHKLAPTGYADEATLAALRAALAALAALPK